jgi:hypothetical protein
MDFAIRALTIVLLSLPLIFLAGASYGRVPLLAPASFLVALYVWIWIWFRPGHFVVKSNVVEVVWPLRRYELRNEVGRGMRVGAGGLWGAFGWLYSQKRGVVRMYVSRLDGFVWIERGAERPWVVTPERPEEFVRALG